MKTNMHYGAPPAIFKYAAILRKNPTKAESKLWSHVRKNYLGFRTRRQHPICIYVVDFYCHRIKLVIEIDGEVHGEELNQVLDLERETILKDFGLHIIRFTNHQVLNHIEDVLSDIRAKIDSIKYPNRV